MLSGVASPPVLKRCVVLIVFGLASVKEFLDFRPEIEGCCGCVKYGK